MNNKLTLEVVFSLMLRQALYGVHF